MSIQLKVKELSTLNNQIKQLQKEIASLRKISTEINNDIKNYLIENDEVGFKYDNHALILDMNTKQVSKPRKVRDESYLNVIEQYGITDSKRFLTELMEAGKDVKEITKLKIHKLQPTA